MGTYVEPLQRREAMRGQAALWGVPGYLVGMVLETSAADRRLPVLMVLEMRRQLASMVSVWLVVLAEMLEKIAEKSVASGQCFAADEGRSFVSSFTLDDYDHADYCTLRLGWFGNLRQPPVDRRCHPPTIHAYIGAARPGDVSSITNTTKIRPICVPILPCLPCFDPVLSRRTIYLMRASQRDPVL